MEGDAQLRGYWGEPTATIDWCERNYTWTPFVAEFFNTISNAFLIVLSAFGVRMCLREGHSNDLAVLFGVIGIVGIGSAAFHGTLLKEAQQLDETPMIIAITQFCYTLYKPMLPGAETSWIWVALLVAHNVGFAILHWDFQWVLAFQLYFSLWCVIACIRLVYLYNHEFVGVPVVQNLILFYVGIWFTGIFFWMVDQHFCETLQSLPVNPEGHAWWHVCTGLASYVGPASLAYFQALHRGMSPSVTYSGGLLPYISAKQGKHVD